MARLCWTALVLAMFLSAQSGEAAVDKEELARLVKELLNVYKPTYRIYGDAPMFSLAISIPLNAENGYNFKQVIKEDPPQNVKNVLKSRVVYAGKRVVGAAVKFAEKFTEHAEKRVFEKFHTLVDRINKINGISSTDLMLFYTFKSPCDTKCANPNHKFCILKEITKIKKWTNYAIVFSKVFKPNEIKPGTNETTPEENCEKALWEIGKKINLSNIYRCTEGDTRCISCNDNGTVNNDCLSMSVNP